MRANGAVGMRLGRGAALPEFDSGCGRSDAVSFVVDPRAGVGGLRPRRVEDSRLAPGFAAVKARAPRWSWRGKRGEKRTLCGGPPPPPPRPSLGASARAWPPWAWP